MTLKYAVIAAMLFSSAAFAQQPSRTVDLQVFSEELGALETRLLLCGGDVKALNAQIAALQARLKELDPAKADEK